MSVTGIIQEFLDLRTILVCSAIFAAIVWILRRPSNLPPGPFRWPLLGSIPGVLIEYLRAGRPIPYKFLEHLSNKYGNLFSIELGSQLLIVANDLETIKEVQKEIDSVVGRNRLPKLSDRDHLPYSDAIILEVSRIATVIPLGVPHAATENTIIKGYNIPKGSMIIQNLWACHYDPSMWEEPKKFNPERFIDEEGRLKKNTENVIPFSSGRRQCIGEQLARKELFIFFTHIMHRFRFEKADDKPLDFEGMLGITYSPKEFMIRAILRD